MLTAQTISDIFITQSGLLQRNFKVRENQLKGMGILMSAFVTRMKTYREKMNLTQEELAGRVGVRRETIVRLEKGRYNPSLKLAADI